MNVAAVAHLKYWLQFLPVVHQVAESDRVTALRALSLEGVLLHLVTEGMDGHTPGTISRLASDVNIREKVHYAHSQANRTTAVSQN